MYRAASSAADSADPQNHNNDHDRRTIDVADAAEHEGAESAELSDDSQESSGGSACEANEETYDEEADHRDAAWLAENHPGATDAVLSCPACFTQICFVCQAHTRFAGQFRALSVVHCETSDQLYAFTKRSGLLEPVAAHSSNGGDVLRAVVCSECGTKVGVIDHEDVYHLSHVLSS
ncbi:hypothetical protein LPJ72_002432 [Coemansia sp. Benny D160-2]|nr:hypothetical protein LPJ72_002432 [Coemansia sp. Benny D160-2]